MTDAPSGEDADALEPRRRSGRIVLTAVAVIAVLVVALVAMAMLSAGPFSTREGAVVAFDAVRSGYGADGDRTLLLSYTGGPNLPEDDPCWVGHRATAAPSGGAIAVTLREVVPSLATHLRHRDVGCTTPASPYLTWVDLPEPLDGRSLVDEATGATVPVFDGRRLLRPTALPPGWSLQAEGGSAIGDELMWNRTFGTVDPLARSLPPGAVDAQWVTVAQAGTGWPAVPPGTRIEGRPTVRGTTGESFLAASTRILTWDEGGQRIVLSNRAADGAALLTEAELVAIAESLVPEG